MLIFTVIVSLIGASAYLIYEAQHIVELSDFDNFFDGWAPPPQIETKVLPTYGIWYEDAIKQGIIQGKNEKQRAINAFMTYRNTYQPFFLLDDVKGITFNEIYQKESARFVETIRLYKGYDACFLEYFHTPGLESIAEDSAPKNIYKEWREWEERGYTYKCKLLNKEITGKEHFSSFGYAKELDYRLSQGACKKCLYAEARFISPMLGTNQVVNAADADAFISHKVMKHWWKLITK
jgi:hypothetical protein